jgi:Flp pilus assembly protein TadG
LRRFLRDRSGGVAITVALAMPMAVGFAAMAVDVGSFYHTSGRLQDAADAAALAAIRDVSNPTAARAAAIQTVSANVPASWGQVTTASDVVLGRFDPTTRVFTANAANPDAVQVTTRRTAARGNAAPTYFSAIFGMRTVDVVASSLSVGTGRYCLIALNPTAANALSIGGSGRIDVPNCGAYSNSSAATSVSSGGSARAVTLQTCAVGGYSGGGFTPTPRTGCPVIQDPLRNIPEPAAPGACFRTNFTITNSETLLPNRTYCGDIRIQANGRVTLQPGLYYFQNATVSLSHQAGIEGSEVLLFFDRNSSFSAASSGRINLTAPSTGTYRGILVFQSRAASGKTNIITGTPDFFMDGTFYMPSSRLEMRGSSGITITSRAGYAIADTFFFGGSSDFAMDSYSGVSAIGSGRGAIVR